jgi:transcription antitermination factor NusG
MVNKWFVVYTKSRNELKVQNHLISIGIDAFTPTRTELRQWSDRKKKVVVPLLPSMVLVRLDEKEAHKVFEIPGVVRYLFEYGKRAEVSNKEVLAMQMYLENIHTLNKQGLAEGDTVQVPMLDQEAILLSLKGKKCIAQLKKLGAIVSFQLK